MHLLLPGNFLELEECHYVLIMVLQSCSTAIFICKRLARYGHCIKGIALEAACAGYYIYMEAKDIACHLLALSFHSLSGTLNKLHEFL